MLIGLAWWTGKGIMDCPGFHRRDPSGGGANTSLHGQSVASVLGVWVFILVPYWDECITLAAELDKDSRVFKAL